MITIPLIENALIPAARSLLLGSFGISLILAIRENDELSRPFERLAMGLIALMFFKPALSGLLLLSQELTDLIQKMGPTEGLKDFVLSSLLKAGDLNSAPQLGDLSKMGAADLMARAKAAAGNALGVFGQVLRTGVWGVASGIAEFLFLISAFVLECARDVLWQMLLILFPMACAVLPVSPRVFQNLCLYAIELALWFPMLRLVDVVTSHVARRYFVIPESLGLYLVAVELVAIALMLMIPAIAHRVVSGAFNSDLGVSATVLSYAKRAVLRGV